jgi:two-component system chemotaxis response regulator CheB
MAASIAAEKPISVLVVDDSKMMRKAVHRIIEPSRELNIVGEASNGEEALMQIAHLRPDVVTLDVEMPLMDGITTLKHMMIQNPTPTVMLSSLTREGSRVTFDALRFGAVDFLTKPSNQSPDGVIRQSEEIVRRVKLAAAVELDSVQYIRTPASPQKNRKPSAKDVRHIVGIGAAEGGPGSLLKLIPGLTPDKPAAYLSMVYMAPEYVGAFAEYLDQHSRIPIHRAEDGQRVETGHGYLASGEEYMTVERSGPGLLLRVHPAPFAERRGSINMMLFAIADAVGSGAAGLLLSGAGRDGSEGMEEILRVGGTGMVLSPGRCMYKEMVTHAIDQCGPGIFIADKGTADEIESLLS